MPIMEDDGVVLIGIPGLKDEYAGRAEELLSDWLGEDSCMFKSPSLPRTIRSLLATGGTLRLSLSRTLVLWAFISG